MWGLGSPDKVDARAFEVKLNRSKSRHIAAGLYSYDLHPGNSLYNIQILLKK